MVESKLVELAVAGSSPVGHPNFTYRKEWFGDYVGFGGGVGDSQILFFGTRTNDTITPPKK